jgi:egghead protein (zeste-white 4 protein)
MTNWSLTSDGKHTLHVIVFICFLVGFELSTGAIRWNPNPAQDVVDPIARYGYFGAAVLYLLRVASLLVLPQCVCNMLGLILFNAFREKVFLKGSPLLAPFICIRVVTKGDYPELVHGNVAKNIKTCIAAGMENFWVEVVTDRAVNLPSNPRSREVVVPTSYQTKTGALFKARALQYCLEDDVNVLRDEDWIVHLDEETLLTENAVHGVLNFCMEGKHQFGQGLITYANGDIINWITTLADSFRVADDMGKLRFQFYYFHKPLFGWKGSYVVTQVSAERKVTFDHGRDGSIAEDCYFSMIAYRDGYSFNFIEGEMHEKSPFNFWDFLQQRKRWLQGIFLVVHSAEIPCKIKFLLSASLYAWASIPFTTSNIVLASVMPLPRYPLFDFSVAYVGAVNLYMYMFGAVKSFSHRYRGRPFRLLLYTVGALLTVPFNICIENVAVLWGMFGRKHQFYVVKKDLQIV